VDRAPRDHRHHLWRGGFLRPTDVKKLVAYSSVSHLGFVMLGLFALNPEGVAGAILADDQPRLSTGALFLLIGMIYEQTHTREIKVYGGLWKITPIFGTSMLISSLSSMGLPGLNGFVGEFTILLGALRASRPPFETERKNSCQSVTSYPLGKSVAKT
jgi:NADH:ubiquinone oxidoreductase subunit 4 (subunit M)